MTDNQKQMQELQEVKRQLKQLVSSPLPPTPSFKFYLIFISITLLMWTIYIWHPW